MLSIMFVIQLADVKIPLFKTNFIPGKFTGKTLLVKKRNGSLYQEKFYVRSKFTGKLC